MRSLAITIGLSMMLTATSASAALKTFNVGVYGVVTGTKTTVACDPGSPDSCLQTYPSASIASRFEQEFNFGLGFVQLEEGANRLTSGYQLGGGFYEIFINRRGDVLSGSLVNFEVYSSDNRFGRIGSYQAFGSTNSFGVTGGVPEPGTWAMMLLGFGAIGASMRRRRRVTAIAQIA